MVGFIIGTSDRHSDLILFTTSTNDVFALFGMAPARYKDTVNDT